MKNSVNDLCKHLGWTEELLEQISDKFSSNKEIPEIVFSEMERIRKDVISLISLVDQGFTPS